MIAVPPSSVSKWGDDTGSCSWTCIGYQVVGPWMSIWLVVAAFAGNIGMYIAEIFEDSWQLFGMARAGLVPRFLGTRNKRFGTPLNSVLVSYVCIAVLVAFDFGDNLAITNFFSCGSCLLELAAFFSLRITHPDLERPFCVPLGTKGVAAMILFPFLLGLVVVLTGVLRSW